jgi:peptidoglycan/LPS O-acetylase OafA/YrhL
MIFGRLRAGRGDSGAGRMQEPGTGRLEQIDVLRGLAAMCVVLAHFTSYCASSFNEHPYGVVLHNRYGFYAVQLFFIISGFVISLTLERSSTWKDFAFSRISRLYPAYWTALTLMVAVEVLGFGKPFWPGGYVTNMTMLQEFMGFANLDNVFWSLTVELAFYAAMGIVFAAGLFARIEAVAAIWLGVACLWSLLQQHLGLELPAFLPRLLILQNLPFFVAGITFYRIKKEGLAPRRVALLLAALAAATLIDGVPSAEAPAIELSESLDRMAVAVILFAVFGFAAGGKLGFAVSPVTLWLGGVSYSLYLCHRNLGYSTMDRLHDLGVPVWLLFTVTVAGAVLLAYALTCLVEQPALHAMRRWYRARTRSMAVGS